ncbi:TKL protein kinase [Aphanomyces invadans]|uniref:TKL protein kinase n=1 Tax=Aphanomyces invadans TaxID=157072 RepID=A0A024UBY6_9STRA|nr:TKL protein kinase [Aphanomyces invadans]ETW03725.1 TKL protein kinase [Aphanomyces invadans]|eukprot:XP_008867954.1 TKL protein kinase [Aphanomyces invadans]
MAWLHAPRSAAPSAPPPMFRLACYILLTLCFCATLVLHFIASVLIGTWALVIWVHAWIQRTGDFHDRVQGLVSIYRRSWLALYKFDAYDLCWYDRRLVHELHVPRDEDEVANPWPQLGYLYLWRGLVGSCTAIVPTAFWAISVFYFVEFFNTPSTTTDSMDPVMVDSTTLTPPWVYLLHGCAYISLGIACANALIPWCIRWCVQSNVLLFPSVNYNLHYDQAAPLVEKAHRRSSRTNSATSTTLRSFLDTVNGLEPVVAVELKNGHEHAIAREVTLQCLALIDELLELFHEHVSPPAWPSTLLDWIESTLTNLRGTFTKLDDPQLTALQNRVRATLARLRTSECAPSPSATAVLHGAMPATHLVDEPYESAVSAACVPCPQQAAARHPDDSVDAECIQHDCEDSLVDLGDLNVMHDMPTRQKRPTALTQLDPDTEYHELSPTAAGGSAPAMYGDLSPRASPSIESVHGVFRSIGAAHPTDHDQVAHLDAVHFQAYAPPIVAAMSTFEFAIWAFLVHQRDDVREHAVTSALSREVLLPVRRGALVHVTLQVPDGFVLVDEPTKALDWQGDITNVQYQVRCPSSATAGQAMFQATIVVGAKVMMLRAYLFVSATRMNDDDDDVVAALSCELEPLEASFHEISFDELALHDGALVGSGHYGDAVRATYRGKEVVVKTLRWDAVDGPSADVVESFRHEAAVLNMFGHHPNIVPFVGAATDESKPLALVTEYLPYGSIADTFAKSSLSVAQKETILYDAAAGLLNVHEGGFVHRDVAARNVLIDPRGRGKLCDFGLCRRVDAAMGGSHFERGEFPLRYMAPESLQPPHAFSYQSDAYMFGVLMWETFTEQTPFASLAPREAAALVLEGHRLECNKDVAVIPLKYQRLIEGCFADDPSKRVSMVDLVHALGRFNVV